MVLCTLCHIEYLLEYTDHYSTWNHRLRSDVRQLPNRFGHTQSVTNTREYGTLSLSSRDKNTEPKFLYSKDYHAKGIQHGEVVDIVCSLCWILWFPSLHQSLCWTTSYGRWPLASSHIPRRPSVLFEWPSHRVLPLTFDLHTLLQNAYLRIDE